MVVTCWSVKGGSGTTVVAACLAVVAARVAARPSLLVDLAGDAPAALGVDQPAGAGLSDWLATAKTVVTPGVGSWTSLAVESGDATTPGDLESFETPVDDRLSLLTSGSVPTGTVTDAAAELLAKRLGADGRFVVVDTGTYTAGCADGLAERLINDADRSLLVIRPCYLALRRVTHSERRVDGVVLIEEPGRSLGADDVASVTGAPVVARLRVEPQVARIVDAGLLCSRVPRNVERPLLDVVEA